MSRQRIILTGATERETPVDVFLPLEAEFTFGLDACATPANAKAPRWHWTQEDGTFVDGLEAPWATISTMVWCNPPYARGSLKRWLAKARDEVALGATVVLLLPADTSTEWFHDFVVGHEVRFYRGRLRFGGTAGPAPFASMLVVMRPAGGRVRVCRV